eukprot:m.357843 g.357843  ORF g.357843 m.357843 type:complete len:965 (-) comp17958_c0_seq1:263-3157(-)
MGGLNGDAMDASRDTSLPMDKQLEPKEEFDAIEKALKTAELVPGDTWYVVGKGWWKEWLGYTANNNGVRPDSINARDIIDTKKRLKRMLVSDYHYIVVPRDVWLYLTYWYMCEEDAEFARTVVVDPDTAAPKVEVQLFLLRAVKDGEMDSLVDLSVSVNSTVQELEDQLRSLFDIDSVDDCQLWNFKDEAFTRKLDNPDARVGDLKLFKNQLICIEVESYGSWPSDMASYQPQDAMDGAGAMMVSGYGGSSTGSAAAAAAAASTGAASASAQGSPRKDLHAVAVQGTGHTGLGNLGNTCFMNSGLQCLSHSIPLRDFFLSHAYVDDLNEDNPIGCGGQLATTFARLLAELWSGRRSSVAPHDFKHVISKFAPQFMGYQQHDSQELTAFLLDGLHEDLNRVKKKPFVEAQTAGDDPDHVAAQAAWERHLMRNQSIIVDKFQGLFKSKLICPECNKVSVTFDPMMYMPLPLPDKSMKLFEVTVRFLDTTRPPVTYGVLLPQRTSSVAHLAMELEDLCGIDSSRLYFCTWYSNRIWKTMQSYNMLSELYTGDELIAFETIPAPADYIKLPVMFRKSDESVTYSYSYSNYKRYLAESPPFVVPLPRTATIDDIRRQVHATLIATTGAAVSAMGSASARGNGAATAVVSSSSSTMASGADVDDEDAIDPDSDDEFEQTYQDNQAKKATLSKADGDDVDGMDVDQDVGADRDADAGSAPDAQQVVGVDGDVDSKPGVAGVVAGDASADYITEAFHIQFYYVANTVGQAIAENETDISNAKSIMLEADSLPNVPQWLNAETHPSCQQRVTNINSIPISDCFRRFASPEKLSEDNMWYCPECKEHRQATKTMVPWSLPDQLIIQLKRFSYNSYFREKISTLVDFPLRGLDLSEFVADPDAKDAAYYDLYAVSNHMGGLGGGHYTAYCVDESGDWYHYDDSWVTRSDMSKVVSVSSYVLYYKRVPRPAHIVSV